MKTGTMLAAAVVAILVAAPMAWARGGDGMRHGGPGRGEGMGMMKALDLTAEQQAKVKALKEQVKKDLEPVHAQMQQKHQELEALWNADPPNEQAILAKHAEMDPLMEQVRARMVHFRLEVHALLTPAQRAKAKELMAKHPEGGPGKHGGPGMHGGMMGPGPMGFPPDLDDEG